MGAAERQRGPCKVVTREFCLGLPKLMEIPLVGYGAGREKRSMRATTRHLIEFIAPFPIPARYELPRLQF